MLVLTQGARMAIRGLTDHLEPVGHGGVRIAVTDESNNGRGPELYLHLASGPAPGDVVVDDDGARVFLDGAAADLLDEQTLDVAIDEVEEQVNFFLS